jgi:hypothetical protein
MRLVQYSVRSIRRYVGAGKSGNSVLEWTFCGSEGDNRRTPDGSGSSAVLGDRFDRTTEREMIIACQKAWLLQSA